MLSTTGAGDQIDERVELGILGGLQGEVAIAVDHLAAAELPEISLAVAAGRSNHGRAGACRQLHPTLPIPAVAPTTSMFWPGERSSQSTAIIAVIIASAA
jgi:hypothetical protein